MVPVTFPFLSAQLAKERSVHARADGTCLEGHTHLLIGRVAERQVGFFKRHAVPTCVCRDVHTEGVGLLEKVAPVMEVFRVMRVEVEVVAGQGEEDLRNGAEGRLEQVFSSTVVAVQSDHSCLTWSSWKDRSVRKS